jgi:hypothetical protein
MPGCVSILCVFPYQRRRELPVADALAERNVGNDPAERQIETGSVFFQRWVASRIRSRPLWKDRHRGDLAGSCSGRHRSREDQGHKNDRESGVGKHKPPVEIPAGLLGSIENYFVCNCHDMSCPVGNDDQQFGIAFDAQG